MTPTARPTGWVLLAKDNTVAVPTLYASLREAHAAGEAFGRRVERARALPTPVWSRRAWAEAMAVDPNTEAGWGAG